jgi:hypothetical protein
MTLAGLDLAGHMLCPEKCSDGFMHGEGSFRLMRLPMAGAVP